MSNWMCTLLTCVLAQASAPTSATAIVVTPPLETRISQALDEPVKADWTDMELGKIVERLAVAARVPIFIDYQALSDEGIDSTMPVTLHLGDSTLGQVQRFLLNPHNLVFVCRPSDLLVTTKTKADEYLSTHIYDVRVLVQALRGKTVMLTEADHQGFWQFGGGGNGYCLSGAGLPPQLAGANRRGINLTRRTEVREVEAALGNVLSLATSAQWEQIDGVGGTISYGDSRLIIRQSSHVHFQVAGILQAVERMVLGKTQSKALSVASRPGYPSAQDAQVTAELDKTTDEQFEDVSLSEVLGGLCSRRKISLWIDAIALLDEGIDPSNAVTGDGAGRTLRTLMDDLLTNQQLTLLIEEGTLVVTTKAKADEVLSARVYHVGEISEAADAGALGQLAQESTSGQWENVDGVGGTFIPLTRDLVVIYQTQSVHAELSALFDGLRRLADPNAAPATGEMLESRVYPVHEASMVPEIEKLLPELYGGKDAWPDGSVRRLGENALLIRQTKARHADAELFFGALETVHQRLHPPPPVVPPEPAKTPPATKPITK